MWAIRIEALETLMHNLHFGLQKLVLFEGFTSVLAVALETLDFGVELAFVLLCVANVFDRCWKSVCLASEYASDSEYTLCENLPLASFRASIRRHSLVKILEKILHFTSSFPLRKLVAYP